MSLDPVQAEIWLFIGLFGAAIPLVALARRSGVSYPIVLVLGGLALGFVPGLPQVALEPDLVLVIFLPPLLYWESITAPTDAMRANAKPIWFLAIGLVVATTAAVAGVAHAFIPQLGWPMAFVLGAIVAPTDELASAPVLDALRMPRALIAIVEGESLLNDATSLILYAAAVGAVVTGAFKFWPTVGWFFFSALGGIIVGWIAAQLARLVWQRVRDTNLQVVVSFTLPYFTFLTAGRLGVSSVLAAVYAGIAANGFTPVVLTPQARLQAAGFWNTVVFLANAILFLLVGLQLHTLVHQVLARYTWLTLILDVLAVNVTVILVRFVWFIGNEFTPGLPLVSGGDVAPNWRRALVAAWSGLRGSVSLAAALAIPVTTLT
jgi:monovalent cation/hydrogen antiporter